MRIVFMGTPDFAVSTLETLIESRHEVVGVVTQPDKPKGRSKKLMPSPVKEAAVAKEIPIFQPERARDPEFVDKLKEISPDVIIVVAYGQILPKEILSLPRFGCINVHASLLPKLRGAAPIQWSVINGDTESGITIMQMDEGLDTGDILLVKKVMISEKETGGSLFDKLSGYGGQMVLDVLELAKKGELKPVPQGDGSTYAKMLTKEMGRIDFSKTAVELERLIRGLNPWPGAFCYLGGKIIKIWDADVLEENEASGLGESDKSFTPGEVVLVSKNDFTVATGDGFLVIKSIQPEGKKRMDTGAFLRGFALETGMIFTRERGRTCL